MTFKETIKHLAAEQRNLKPQRKTVHFKGGRTIDSWEAKELVEKNKFTLRHMYIAYHKLRKPDVKMEKPKRAYVDQRYVDKLILQYSKEYKKLELNLN